MYFHNTHEKTQLPYAWQQALQVVIKLKCLCTRRSGDRAITLARVFRISKGLSRYSPMSEVFAPRYLAGLVSTHG